MTEDKQPQTEITITKEEARPTDGKKLTITVKAADDKKVLELYKKVMEDWK